MRRLSRTLGLLSRIAHGSVRGDDSRLRYRTWHSEQGLACDEWGPSSQTGPTVVALHGATLNGKGDHRLQAFARALAASGIRCVVPTLRGLSRLQWGREDAKDVAALLVELQLRDGSPAGLIGFSFGGSCALLAAARSGMDVRFVVSFGAVYSFEALYDELHSARESLLHDPKGLSGLLYTALVMAWRRNLLADPEQVRALEELLRGFCEAKGAGVERRLAFYQETLAALDPIGTEYGDRDLAALQAASPAGQLAGLRCPVSLLHDATDTLVPPSHSRRIYEELGQSAGGHALLVTRLLSHVSPGSFRALGDVPALLRILSILVG